MGIEYGWEYGFGSAGIGLILGWLVFVTQTKHLQGQAEPGRPELLDEKRFGIRRETLIYIGALIGVVVVQQILQTRFDFGALAAILGLAEDPEITATEVVAILMTIALLIWWFKFIFVECSKVERAKYDSADGADWYLCCVLGLVRTNLWYLAGIFRSGDQQLHLQPVGQRLYA